MLKSRSLLAALACLVLSAAAFSATAAPARTPAAPPAVKTAAPASAPAAATAPAPAESPTSVTTAAARKEEDPPLVDSASAELATNGNPEPGELTGELGADVQSLASGPPSTHVAARVLADCAYGNPNSVADVPAGEVDEAVSQGLIDTHPAAVDFARRLAAGEIEA